MTIREKKYLDQYMLPYQTMHTVGMIDGVEAIKGTIEESIKEGAEFTTEKLIEVCDELIAQFNGEKNDQINATAKLEDLDEAPEEFKSKGMSDEAYKAFIKYRKENMDYNEDETKEEPMEEETSVEMGSILDYLNDDDDGENVIDGEVKMVYDENNPLQFSEYK